MFSRDEFVEIENRIRALTTILKNLNYHVKPSSDPRDVPSFLRHFANLLTTGDTKSPEAKKVVAVTGSIHANGTTSTLIVTQNPFLKSGVGNLRIVDVTKSEKSFHDIVDLNRDDNVVLNEYISDLWAALVYYQSHPDSSCYKDLHIFVVYRSYRKLFKRVKQDTKTWNVHVADKIRDWTPKPNELRGDPQWLPYPDWFAGVKIQPEMMKTRKRGPPGNEFVEIEFSSATVGFWAWLLGRLLSSLEDVVERAGAKIKNDAQSFKEDLAAISDRIYLLYRYVNWNARVVETLLTGTSLAKSFCLPETVQCDAQGDDDDIDDDDNSGDDSADMSREQNESDGHLVLRHLRSIIAWSAALDSLTNNKHLSIINGKFDVGLVQVPHPGHSIAKIEDIVDEFFKRYPPLSDYDRARDTAHLERNWKDKFTGTVHAEATLMGLLKYFSEPNPSKRVDYHNELQGSNAAERLQVLIGPTTMMTDKAIGVGKKCCWCCSTLGSIVSQDEGISIKLPGSHGIIFPWSPPNIGLDTSILRAMEERLWARLRRAVNQAESAVPLSRQSSGSSSIHEEGKGKYSIAESVAL